MAYHVLDDNGEALDARLDVERDSIVLHSRGGHGKGAAGLARNSQYGPALRLILERLSAAKLGLSGVWVDSTTVQAMPLSERVILQPSEASAGTGTIFRLMSARMKAIGRAPNGAGGNPTKRIRLGLSSSVSAAELQKLLRLRHAGPSRSRDRLPASDLRMVTAEHIWNAVQVLCKQPSEHAFGESTDFDLLGPGGERLPPKAVFGVAASEALGFRVLPKHFSGGADTVCFRILQAAGYDIVAKGARGPGAKLGLSAEDRRWAEGRQRLVAHLRRERASGLAEAKRESFRREHGKLFCEKCLVNPVRSYGGSHGEACIEVHHRAVTVEEMGEGHSTKLSDLECLCANCHRVEHRLLKIKVRSLEGSLDQQTLASAS